MTMPLFFEEWSKGETEDGLRCRAGFIYHDDEIVRMKTLRIVAFRLMGKVYSNEIECVTPLPRTTREQYDERDKWRSRITSLRRLRTMLLTTENAGEYIQYFSQTTLEADPNRDALAKLGELEMECVRWHHVNIWGKDKRDRELWELSQAEAAIWSPKRLAYWIDPHFPNAQRIAGTTLCSMDQAISFKLRAECDIRITEL